MDYAPTVEDVQGVIDAAWAAEEHRGAPPTICRTLVFYNADEELEAFAVVERGGRGVHTRCYSVGTWEVTAVEWNAEIALSSMGLPVGGTVLINGFSRLLLAVDGGLLPHLETGLHPQGLEDWRCAVKHFQCLDACLAKSRAAQSHLLRSLHEKRLRLEKEAEKLPEVPALEAYRPLLRTLLTQQQHLEADMAEIEQLCTACPNTDAAGLALLVSRQAQMAACLEEQAETDSQQLQPFRAQCAEIEDSQWSALLSTGKKAPGQLALQMSEDPI